MMSSEEAGPTPLLWSIQELRAVRASGLVGVPVGCLPRAPRQNGRLGRPLLLLPEELQLIQEEQITQELQKHTREDRGTASEELEQEQEVLEEQDQEVLEQQDQEVLEEQQDQELLEEQDQEVLEEQKQQKQEEVLVKHRLKLQQFLSRSLEQQRELALTERKSALTSSHSGAKTEALMDRLEALDHSFVFPPSALAVQLSTCRAGLPHLSSSEPIGKQQQGSEPIGRQQGDNHSQLRMQVFRDLRRRGFYLTSGGKFGADFLVYPGDPLRVHAHFMAVCVTLEDSVSLRDVLSWTRLASNVKKTLLLCSCSPPGGVQYSSLQWSGLS